jgi:hypothetical protein
MCEGHFFVLISGSFFFIRSQRAAVTNSGIANLATHLPNLLTHPPSICFVGMGSTHKFVKQKRHLTFWRQFCGLEVLIWGEKQRLFSALG